MKKFNLKKETGEVKSFDERTGTGVLVIKRSRYNFEATSFRSGRPVRYPRVGESVDAVLSEGGKRLVSVWARGDDE